mmetsp:Transcript_30167/g.33704  ORF Transcript_30167/g.33704 Transcript_30167/m.33704 type:complete len:86 (+) Transcript_30167:683-940(+)
MPNGFVWKPYLLVHPLVFPNKRFLKLNLSNAVFYHKSDSYLRSMAAAALLLASVFDSGLPAPNKACFVCMETIRINGSGMNTLLR